MSDTAELENDYWFDIGESMRHYEQHCIGFDYDLWRDPRDVELQEFLRTGKLKGVKTDE